LFLSKEKKMRKFTEGSNCWMACKQYFSSLKFEKNLWRTWEVNCKFWRWDFNVTSICNRSISLSSRSNSRHKISTGKLTLVFIISNKRMIKKHSNWLPRNFYFIGEKTAPDDYIIELTRHYDNMHSVSILSQTSLYGNSSYKW
jgi:hypothetical protein